VTSETKADKEKTEEMPTLAQNTTALSRDKFDADIRAFMATLEEVIQTTPYACPFLESTVGSVLSLRYHDRIYLDLCAFSQHLAPGSRILDLGTGSGILGYLLAAQGHSVEAIDVDDFNEVQSVHSQMSAEQKLLWKALTARQTGIRFQHYYNSKIPFEASAFDAVIAYGVIEHVPESVLPAVMKDVARVTKLGGKLMISYLPRKWALLEIVLGMMGRLHHLRRWGDQELRQFLNDFGYEIVVLERIIFAPQFPASSTNRYKGILDSIDLLAKIPPFSLLARDLMGVARKRES
jgi:2-polyprenyl-3-methyl-5-hydroxy-6-metoxy-1,4-benzoquinol methylase